QQIHGLSPLWAGYVTALVAAGWSASAITAAGWTGGRVRAVIVIAPALMGAAALTLALTLPSLAGGPVVLTLVGIALFALGCGLGPPFRHLGARVLSPTTAADNDRTSAGLGMVQLFASGLGAAIGGVAVTAAGLPLAETQADIAHAAQVLFGVFAVIAAMG